MGHVKNINGENSDRFTPLGAASLNGHFEIAKLLVNSNADVNFQDREGNTPLMRSTLRRGKFSIANLLIQNDANVNLVNKYDETALLNASRNGHLKMVELFLTKNADIHHVRGKPFG